MEKRTIYITCTQPRADEMVADLRRDVIADIIACPALDVHFLTDITIPQGQYDAMVISSRHVLKALNVVELPRGLPVIAVGRNTAKSAEEKGFQVVQVGSGGVNDLDFSDFQSVLYPCAVDSSSIPDDAGVTVWPVYKTNPKADFTIDSRNATVCLFSVRGARHYFQQSFQKTHDVLCLSQAVADVFGGNICAERLAVCDMPSYDAMKQLIMKKMDNK